MYVYPNKAIIKTIEDKLTNFLNIVVAAHEENECNLDCFRKLPETNYLMQSSSAFPGNS